MDKDHPYPKPTHLDDTKCIITEDMVSTLIAMVESGKKEDHDLAISIFRNRNKKDKETIESWRKIHNRLETDGYKWAWVARGRMGYKKVR